MKNLPLLFFGFFGMLAASWTALVLAANIQLGGLQPAAVDEGGTPYPQLAPGMAQQGKQVYIEMGCVACHTQQVRPDSLQIEKTLPKPGQPGETETVYISPDIARHWSKAERGSVARDYIFQDRVLLGSMRIGPDLADAGDRAISAPASDWLMLHFYDPQLKSPGTVMPSFRFLFKEQEIKGKPAANALKFPAGYAHGPTAGHEIVPGDDGRAVALVAYIRGLKLDYELPEARTPVIAPAPAAHGAVPAAPGAANGTVKPASSVPATPAPAAANTTLSPTAKP